MAINLKDFQISDRPELFLTALESRSKHQILNAPNANTNSMCMWYSCFTTYMHYICLIYGGNQKAKFQVMRYENNHAELNV